MTGGLSRAMVRIIAAHVFLQACMAGTRMAAPLLALRDGHSQASVGVLLALFALTQVFLALPAGRFADRHGLRRPVGYSVLAAMTGAGLAVVWPIFPVLCLSALLTGGATGMASIALQRHVGRAAETPTQLKQAFSWLAIGPAVSNFLGPFTAGLVIDHGGYRLAFFVLAMLPVVSWYWVRAVTELPPVVASPHQAKGRAWDLFADPSFRRLLLVNWFLSSCWDVHTFIVPVLGHERGIAASVIGTILGGFAIAATVIRVLMPLLAARLREWAVIAGAMAMTAVLFGIYPFMDTALGMGVCSMLLGCSLGSVQPMVMSMLHQITPEHRHGEAVAMRIMAINASSVTMPLLFGAAGSLIGISGVFWIVGAVVGAGVKVAFRLGRDLPAHEGGTYRR